MNETRKTFTADELVELGHDIETTGRVLTREEAFAVIDTALEAIRAKRPKEPKPCTCGDRSAKAVHRTDGPCYVTPERIGGTGYELPAAKRRRGVSNGVHKFF